MYTQMIRHHLAEVDQAASRLHSILMESLTVRIRIGEMRDAAARFDAALTDDVFGPQELCDLMNTLNHLQVFFVNSGTGLEQGGQTSLHPLAETMTLEHLDLWIAYLDSMASVLREGDNINEWLVVNPIPPGQPGTLPVSVLHARRARIAAMPPPPPPIHPTEPRLTRRFMFRYLPLMVMGQTNEPIVFQVEVVDGELNPLSENMRTVYVIGEPVTLPHSPCPADEWDPWFAEFLRTHRLASRGTILENVGHRTETCYVIREAERED